MTHHTDTINIGDTVILKSQWDVKPHQPVEPFVKMTVNGIKKDSDFTTGLDLNYLECVWFDSKNRFCSGSFHFNALHKIK